MSRTCDSGPGGTMGTMTSWARLDVGSHQRTRWQRFKHWLLGKPEQVYVSSEIAHATIQDVAEDYFDDRHPMVARAHTR